MLHSILHDTHLQSPGLRAFADRLEAFSSRRYIIWILFGLGIVRNVILLLAYPPARIADSPLFFLYAEQFAGEVDAPLAGQIAYPLYPLLILIAFRWLGSIYWLIGLQFLMSALIAPLYYAALKRYSASLALLAGAVILGDMQVGLMFNFVSTEPLYIFLLALAFYVFLKQVESPPGAGDLAAGLLFAALLLTRAVARFLVAPLAVIFWLRTRNWRRTLTLLLGFGVGLILYALLSSAAVGSVEGLASGDYMIGSILFNYPEWVKAEHGPNSVRWLELQEQCPNFYRFLTCAQTKLGSWDETMRLFSAAARETMLNNLLPYIQSTWQKTMDFISLPALVLGVDPELPSGAQCASVDELSLLSDKELMQQTRVWLLGIRSEEQMAAFRPRLEAFLRSLCPPLPHVPQFRSAVDFLSWRYRSLGRPQPYLWYGALVALVLLLPWARRYAVPVAASGVVLLYHALISAVIANVQPRYVVVVNPMRAILLCTLIYLVLRLAGYAVDWALSRRRVSRVAFP